MINKNAEWTFTSSHHFTIDSNVEDNVEVVTEKLRLWTRHVSICFVDILWPLPCDSCSIIFHWIWLTLTRTRMRNHTYKKWIFWQHGHVEFSTNSVQISNLFVNHWKTRSDGVRLSECHGCLHRISKHKSYDSIILHCRHQILRFGDR